jgi:hypothetical protein
MRPWKFFLLLIPLVGASACAAGPPTPCSTHVAGGSGGEEDESALMSPGGDCIGCHGQGEGPRFDIAGTVMGATNDATDCGGISGVHVRITGDDGALIDLMTNEAGNFYRSAGASPPLVTPFSVVLERGGKERPMVRTQTDSNCMHCHTAQGAQGAPGRILAP